MGKGSGDFKHRKQKVGKKKLASANVTNTSFKWATLHVAARGPGESDLPSWAGGPSAEDAAAAVAANEERFSDLLRHFSHHSADSRKEAVVAVLKSIVATPMLLLRNLGRTLLAVAQRLGDPESPVRSVLPTIVRAVAELASAEQLAPFAPTFFAYLSSSLASLQPGIRLDALASLAAWSAVRPVPAAAVPRLMASVVSLLESQHHTLVAATVLLGQLPVCYELAGGPAGAAGATSSGAAASSAPSAPPSKRSKLSANAARVAVSFVLRRLLLGSGRDGDAETLAGDSSSSSSVGGRDQTVAAHDAPVTGAADVLLTLPLSELLRREGAAAAAEAYGVYAWRPSSSGRGDEAGSSTAPCSGVALPAAAASAALQRLSALWEDSGPDEAHAALAPPRLRLALLAHAATATVHACAAWQPLLQPSASDLTAAVPSAGMGSAAEGRMWRELQRFGSAAAATAASAAAGTDAAASGATAGAAVTSGADCLREATQSVTGAFLRCFPVTTSAVLATSAGGATAAASSSASMPGPSSDAAAGDAAKALAAAAAALDCARQPDSLRLLNARLAELTATLLPSPLAVRFLQQMGADEAAAATAIAEAEAAAKAAAAATAAAFDRRRAGFGRGRGRGQQTAAAAAAASTSGSAGAVAGAAATAAGKGKAAAPASSSSSSGKNLFALLADSDDDDGSNDGAEAAAAAAAAVGSKASSGGGAAADVGSKRRADRSAGGAGGGGGRGKRRRQAGNGLGASVFGAAASAAGAATAGGGRDGGDAEGDAGSDSGDDAGLGIVVFGDAGASGGAGAGSVGGGGLQFYASDALVPAAAVAPWPGSAAAAASAAAAGGADSSAPYWDHSAAAAAAGGAGQATFAADAGFFADTAVDGSAGLHSSGIGSRFALSARARAAIRRRAGDRIGRMARSLAAFLLAELSASGDAAAASAGSGRASGGAAAAGGAGAAAADSATASASSGRPFSVRLLPLLLRIASRSLPFLAAALPSSVAPLVDAIWRCYAAAPAADEARAAGADFLQHLLPPIAASETSSSASASAAHAALTAALPLAERARLASQFVASLPRLLWALGASRPELTDNLLGLLQERLRRAPPVAVAGTSAGDATSAGVSISALRDCVRQLVPLVYAVRKGAGADGSSRATGTVGAFLRLPAHVQERLLSLVGIAGPLSQPWQRALSVLTRRGDVSGWLRTAALDAGLAALAATAPEDGTAAHRPVAAAADKARIQSDGDDGDSGGDDGDDDDAGALSFAAVGADGAVIAPAAGPAAKPAVRGSKAVTAVAASARASAPAVYALPPSALSKLAFLLSAATGRSISVADAADGAGSGAAAATSAADALVVQPYSAAEAGDSNEDLAAGAAAAAVSKGKKAAPAAADVSLAAPAALALGVPRLLGASEPAAFAELLAAVAPRIVSVIMTPPHAAAAVQHSAACGAVIAAVAAQLAGGKSADGAAPGAAVLAAGMQAGKPAQAAQAAALLLSLSGALSVAAVAGAAAGTADAAAAFAAVAAQYAVPAAASLLASAEALSPQHIAALSQPFLAAARQSAAQASARAAAAQASSAGGLLAAGPESLPGAYGSIDAAFAYDGRLCAALMTALAAAVERRLSAGGAGGASAAAAPARAERPMLELALRVLSTRGSSAFLHAMGRLGASAGAATGGASADTAGSAAAAAEAGAAHACARLRSALAAGADAATAALLEDGRWSTLRSLLDALA